ncbi:hypothetical protein BC830DRAFT_1131437 [Chytriomyces sp. MP71]|nr:hypothetical protein BC830DRAFT_1131437 [Chytriomyces sp. MP71]
MNGLPPELTAAIFSFLHPSTVQRYSRICYRIRAILHSSGFLLLNLSQFRMRQAKPLLTEAAWMWFYLPTILQEAYADLELFGHERIAWTTDPFHTFDGRYLTRKRLPDAVSRLQSLTVLKMTYLYLSGPLPEVLFELKLLEVLNLSSNDLQGCISPKIERLSSLKELNLSCNNLGGAIPDEIAFLKSLKVLQLRENRFESYPECIGSLIQLEFLDLAFNQLNCDIFESVGNLTQLEILHLYSNALKGPLPLSLGNLTSMKSLVLLENSLTGKLPDSLGNLVFLNELDLRFNQLSGSIPTTFKRLFVLGESSFPTLRLKGNPDFDKRIPRDITRRDPVHKLLLDDGFIEEE